jgi:threonine dehydratase
MNGSKNLQGLVTIDGIRAAAERIKPYVLRTPTLLLAGRNISLKAESLQPTGSFKLRGAFNAVLKMPAEKRKAGLVAHSSGNHAQAVAYVAHRLGISSTIVMPENAPRLKIDATRRWGAEIVIVGSLNSDRVAMAARLRDERGLSPVEPFDSDDTIEGAATVGLEIAADTPDVETVFVTAAGGGLLAGVAVALKNLAPHIRVVGVQPALADHAARSFGSGQLTSIPDADAARTIADGMRIGRLGDRNWAHIERCVDEFVTVPEEAILAAMRMIATEARLIAEPSGAVALAGALAANRGKSLATISGGNVDPARFAEILHAKEAHKS